MKITITFDVESRDAMNQILQVGKEYSLYDYKIDNFVYGTSLDTLTAKAELFNEATRLLAIAHAVMTTHRVGGNTALEIADLINNRRCFRD